MTIKITIRAALLAAAALVATAPAASASVGATGWVHNPIVTQGLCMSLVEEIGAEAGFTVNPREAGATLNNDDGDLVIIVCDAEPYIFFVAVHDTRPVSEVRAVADDIERRLVARLDAMPTN